MVTEVLEKLTERIVDTYAEVGSLHHLGHCPLPNYDTIIAATEDLKEILYPGYRRRDGLHLGNVTYHVGDVIDRLHDQLTEQIARSLRHEAGEAFTCGPQQKADYVHGGYADDKWLFVTSSPSVENSGSYGRLNPSTSSVIPTVK